MSLVLLDRRLWFPPTTYASSEGLLAVGGDLSVERLLLAYRSGIFPWFNEDSPILWWSPDPRFVLFPKDLVLRRSLRKVLKQNRFTVKFDQKFQEVIRACASPRANQPETWITPEMERAYLDLYRIGIAHSVETYWDDRLVGGLYGLAMGPFFFGESMFHLESNASKVALAALVHAYRHGVLIDCQVENPFFSSMGAASIPRDSFLNYLTNHLNEQPCWPQNKIAPTTSTILEELARDLLNAGAPSGREKL